MRNFISTTLALELYKSLNHPHFNFGDIIYDGCSQTLKHKLQTHQNMALRAVANVNRQFSTTAVHNITGVTWLDVERQKHCCTQVYKSLNDLTANNVAAMFAPIDHSAGTRAQTGALYRWPLAKTVLSSQNLPIRVYNYWKCLPSDVRLAPSVSSLKYHLKKFEGFVHNYKY